jgi:hypothetical protein
MRPSTGARVVMDLVSASGEGVVYRAALYLPDAEWQGRAEVCVAGGEVRFARWEPDAPAPPEWLVKLAHAFLRAEWRARSAAGEAGEPTPWPARINRWRETR